MAIACPARLHPPQACRRTAALANLQSSTVACRWHGRRLLPVAASPLRLRTVRATDGARQPFDNGTYAIEEESGEHPRLKIAIVGFGSFGEFLARTLARQGHTVLAHSRSDHSAAAAALGATFFADPQDLCEGQPDVVLLATSILSAGVVLRSLPDHSFSSNNLFLDVPPVKEFPKNLFLTCLPEDVDIICAHPMFGPESGSDSWAGLSFVYDKIRVGDCARAEAFLDIFAREGCRMVEMPYDKHDDHAAETQFLKRTVGRLLDRV